MNATRRSSPVAFIFRSHNCNSSSGCAHETEPICGAIKGRQQAVRLVSFAPLPARAARLIQYNSFTWVRTAATPTAALTLNRSELLRLGPLNQRKSSEQFDDDADQRSSRPLLLGNEPQRAT